YDLRMAKVLTAGEDSAQQNSGVDGRNFRIPNSFSVGDIGKVIKKSSMVWQFLPKEAEGDKNALERIAAGNQAALISDAEGGQAKARSCNAGYDSFIIGADVAPVFHHPRFRAGLLPKITEV